MKIELQLSFKNKFIVKMSVLYFKADFVKRALLISIVILSSRRYYFKSEKIKLQRLNTEVLLLYIKTLINTESHI